MHIGKYQSITRRTSRAITGRREIPSLLRLGNLFSRLSTSVLSVADGRIRAYLERRHVEREREKAIECGPTIFSLSRVFYTAHARGSKSPVANYAGPKYFRSDFVRREMERREGGWEVGGGEGSRSRIRVFAPLAQSTPPHVLAMRG